MESDSRPEAESIHIEGFAENPPTRIGIAAGDIVTVNGVNYTVTAVLKRHRLHIRPVGRVVARHGTPGRAARAGLADAIRQAAQRAIADGENVTMTPAFVTEILLPAVLAGD